MALSPNPNSLSKGIVSRDGTLTVARQVQHVGQNNTGILTTSDNVEESLNRLDGTGIGSAPVEFTGSLFATYGAQGNQNIWYGGKQNGVIVGSRGQANGNYTFRLPDIDDLNTMFDDLAARNLPERWQRTIQYLGGNTSSVVRNSLTITLPSITPGFTQGEFPVTIAQGAQVTIAIERIGGVLSPWERVSVGQSQDPVATFGEVVLQSTGWNNADSSFLPSGAMVQKGYAFPVIGSNPNDGTLRQGLLDAGVSDRVIYDGDYVVWTADAFSSWSDGDNWFVLSRNDLQRMSREESNFLSQVSEIDNRIDVAPVSALTNDALVWLSENPLAEAPFLNPSTDPNNPRSGDQYPYIGGRDDRNAEMQFTFGQNRFNNYMTVGITPSFITGHPESDIRVRVRDGDGTVLDDFNLATDFTFRDDATFTNATVRHYTRSTSVNYPFLATIEIVLTQVQRHFRMNPVTVDATPNVSNIIEDQLTDDVRDKLNRPLPDDSARFQEIEPRLSPYKNVTTNTPAHDALFLDTDGTDAYPINLDSFNSVSVDNPRYTGNNVALFIAVPEPGDFALRNITTQSIVALAQGQTDVEVIESLSVNGVTYFVYIVSNLTAGHVYEVERVSVERVVAWPDDIKNLQGDVDRIDAELSHALLNLSDEVVQVFENEVSVTEEQNATIVPTAYNIGLAGPTNTTQTVFREANPNAGSGGQKASKPISETAGTDRERRKLIYFPLDATYVNQAYVRANDGTQNRALIRYNDGVFNARVFVPAKPASTSTETIYPAPSNRVSGAGIWQTIEALTFQNGVPVAEADELFFTRNIPTSATTLTIQYRGHANGNVFGAASTTLANVGGSTDAITNFTLSVGSEVVSVEVRYTASTRQIRVSETSRVTSGLPTVEDIQVILSYTETRTIPATPDTVRDVPIESLHSNGQVFAIKPNAAGNLIIVGDTTEIDTGYSYTTLFGASENGQLIALNENVEFFDYEDFEPIDTTIRSLQNHATLPQFGLFTTQYTDETILEFDVTLEAPAFILTSPNGDRWEVTIDDTGALTTAKVV